MYRARSTLPTQRQITHLKVEANAFLEWFPMESIVYPGASTEIQTNIHLSASSRFISWEITCFGLPASGQHFDVGSFSQRYAITHNNLPIFIDRLQLDAKDRCFFEGHAGMQGQSVNGFMVAGGFQDAALESLIELLREKINDLHFHKLIAVTNIADFLVVRYLGGSAFQCRQVFIELWKLFRPILLGKIACEPRIWLT